MVEQGTGEVEELLKNCKVDAVHSTVYHNILPVCVLMLEIIKPTFKLTQTAVPSSE